MKIPFVYINLLFLFTAPLASYGAYFSYALIILSWFGVIPLLFIFYKIDLLTALFSVLIYDCIVLGIMRHEKTLRNLESELNSGLEAEEYGRSELTEKLSALERSESEIKESELSMVSLYEATKKMSEDLKFNDIFNVFSAFLKSNFKFKTCDLVILNWDDETPKLDRKYSVYQTDNREPSPSDIGCVKLINFCLNSPKKLYFTRRDDKDIFETLEIKDEEIGSYVVMPLVSNRKIVAILTVGNLEREDLEKFIILSMQFALEIKKVLLYETVERLATTDSLTNLYVRQYFSERLAEELQRSRRYKYKFAVLMIDIDNFKKANDTYGHLVGDVILKSLSQILKENTREIDLVSRYGGEEFTVGLPETGLDGAMIVAERIRKRTEENIFKAYDEKLKITVSIGVSVYPKDAAKLKDLIDNADKAMYNAKKKGKNLVCEYKK